MTILFGMLCIFGSVSEINEGIHVTGGTNHGVIGLQVGGCLNTDPKRDVGFGFIRLFWYYVCLSFF